MSGNSKSPIVSFLKIVFFCGLLFIAYFIGDNLGHKRGFQETANYTIGKLGIEKTVADRNEYDAAINAYLAESRSLNRSIENIFSTENLGERAGNLVTDFINRLFGN